MRLGTVLAALIFTFAAVALAVWLGQPSNQTASGETPPEATVDDWPEISDTGPHPRAVAPETTYEFGKMYPGEEASHAFVIRNEGQAPLVLGKGHHTCKCTLSELATRSIPPGQSGEITLTWHPEDPLPMFAESAEIRTNDPDQRVIKFVVQGMVEDAVRMMPLDIWDAGDVPADEPVVLSGTLTSSFFDEFQVTELKSLTDRVTAEAVPMTEEVLEPLGARSGYVIQATVPAGGPLGRFMEEFIVRTDIGKGTSHRVTVSGRREGPVHFVPLPGVEWIGERFRAHLGTFPADRGKEVSLLMFVDVPEEREIKVQVAQTSPEFLEATLTQDTGFRAENRVRYRLTIQVPPGLPPETRIGKNAGTVTLTTNHPGAAEIAIRVEFITHRDT